MNQTLWGGWLFEWKGYRVHFSGDTGYSALFKNIRRRDGETDVCL
jgi:N-acyl-phosphatidylethanolamine-hydrolysing phospholipase D